jgi:hypothetical protein
MSQVPFGMGDNQNSNVTLAVADAQGNPTGSVIDPGSLTVTSSDPAITVAVGADGVSFDAKATGPLNAAVVVTATATVGGVSYSGTETFDVGASAPSQLILTPGAPVAN